ncbi:aminotransferase class III-fold pyridoxal phosphate-dependent enzyme [Flavobacteriaceae bacterium TP-CH-4]|uniref:Aminotransferase class III-fold pyridoxal phosphate-dependent enzyme n=1 Tax=Pelagihabitans pacificus TaxID=2696054 RepID=A0A967AVS8_9FLAO|nr:aminotransferase class III-fold pyridoxal phosphate-dependent enzyme [Pelagihabitans pacificus]NHF60070.1 aminotransferase class III-fold pyridoxal phosphate-dependent enzyme [Pelagihabitans pacificus]
MVDLVLKERFSIPKARLTPLEGYESTNFKVESDKGVFVLKQYPFTEETYTLLEAENKLLSTLGTNKEYAFSNALLSNEGMGLTVANGCIYRLLTYVEGDFLGDVEHSESLLHSLGLFLGKMDQTISHTYDAAIAAKTTRWDLQHFKRNYRYLPYITDPKQRSLVDYFFLQFDENVYPVQDVLRMGIIHNDANDWNVLTKNGKVSGIIDFGDMCHSWQINELAIGITYVMMGKETPLAVAAKVIKGYQTVFPLEEVEVDVLYYLVAARLCTSVCNSAYSKTLKPDSSYIIVSEKPAWDLLKKWLTINPIKAGDVFRKAAGFKPSPKRKLVHQLERRNTFLSSALSLSYDRPLQMHRSAFQYMYDTEGNAILDAYNNIMLVGHSHPTVVRAGQRAMAKLNTNTRYLYDELMDYSEQLLSKFPPSLNKVFFVNSGSAASDLAIRIAMTHTRKRKVMVLEHGYHGNTRIGIDISHYKYNHQGGPGQQDYILPTPMPKAFGSGMPDDGTAGRHFAEIATEEMMEHQDIAAFIAEPIVGCGGQVPLANGYLKELYPKIRAQGGICISDEVQVGFGRLGDYFWGFEMHGIVPDLVILGKPMGNGHPIGAVVTTTGIAESFDNGLEFFSSFGGNPVSCAIGLAVLQVIEEEGLQQHAKETGDYLKSLLDELKRHYPQIADVRGSGMFLGIEIEDKEGAPNTVLASRLKNALREKNILIGTDGPFDSVLKIKPPLSFNRTDCRILVGAIESVLSDFAKK